MRRLLLCLLALITIRTMRAQEDNCNSLCGRRPLASSHSLPVVGGIDTLPGTWPWMVSIRTPFKSGYQHTCGGSLIGARWILTAAHCFRDIRHLTNWELVFGTNKLSHPGPDAEVRFPKRVVQHENYQPRQQINDIALVELDDPVKCSDYIQPACLPDSSVDVSSMVHCYIAGWGYTREKDKAPSDVLKEAKVGLIPIEKCNSSNWYYGSISTSNLCAGFEGGGIDTCQGDSGGPLICRENRSERYWIVGVTAWGLGCARAQKPGVYTSTQNFYDWILGYTKKKTTHEEASPVPQAQPGMTSPPTTSKPEMTSSPTTSKPETTSSPTTSKPEMTSPITSKPETTSPPTTSKPETTSPPTTSKPETTSPPTTSKPETTSPPTTSEPETTSPPTTAKPETTSPSTTAKPETTSPPTTAKPETTSPSTTSSPLTPTPTTSTNETSPPAPEQTSRKQEISPQIQLTPITESTTTATTTPRTTTETIPENTTEEIPEDTTEEIPEDTTEATPEETLEAATEEIPEANIEATTGSSTTTTTPTTPPTTTKAPQRKVPPPKPERPTKSYSFYGYSGNANWPKNWPFRRPRP